MLQLAQCHLVFQQTASSWDERIRAAPSALGTLQMACVRSRSLAIVTIILR